MAPRTHPCPPKDPSNPATEMSFRTLVQLLARQSARDFVHADTAQPSGTIEQGRQDPQSPTDPAPKALDGAATRLTHGDENETPHENDQARAADV